MSKKAKSGACVNSSKVDEEKQKDSNNPPDGGVVAWLQAIGAFFLYFNTWGLIASYGSFHATYESSILRHRTPFMISTIGSVQSFLMVFMGFIVGPIYDAGYFRHLLVTGSILITFGTMMQSVSTTYWQLLLSQGVCIGLGAGCLVILSVAVTALWFTKRLPLANGIAASGSGVGGIVFPIVFRALQPRIGFGWSVRIIGAVAAITLGIANILLKIPPRHKTAGKRRNFIDKSVFRDRPYLIFVLGCFVVFLGLYSPFVYINSFTRQNLPDHPAAPDLMIPIMNFSSIFGRILPILFARKIGPLNMMIMASIALSISGLALMAVYGSLTVLLILITIYGFLTGTFFALQPTIFVGLTQDKSKIGTRFGMAFSVLSIALLFGPPTAGALMRVDGYYSVWSWVGVVILLGSLIICAARIISDRPKRSSISNTSAQTEPPELCSKEVLGKN